MEAGLIDEKEALEHEKRHLVSDLIGDPNMSIEVGPVVEVAQKDTLIIASDGLFDNLLQNEVIENARKGQLLASTRSSFEIAVSRMENSKDSQPSKPDDLTFLLFRRRD